MGENIVANSFVAVSDFHSYEWPLEKILNYYLHEYNQIYILGDATDRGKSYEGKGGVELLLNIKEFSERYPNRIIYVPGNHDSFLYDYAAHKDERAFKLLQINGGSQTVDDIETLEHTNREQYRSLVNWLGNLPLQRVHTFDGRDYALAHAFFNKNIYQQYPNFSLKDLCALKNKPAMYSRFSQIIWFRKGKDGYNPQDLPSADITMVIGHTPQKSAVGQNLDLKNAKGEIVPVKCVDGGIAYSGQMLKYDGGPHPIRTKMNIHNDTSPKKVDPPPVQHSDFDDFLSNQERKLDDFLVNIMYDAFSKKEGYDMLKSVYLQSLLEGNTLKYGVCSAGGLHAIVGAYRDSIRDYKSTFHDLYLEYATVVTWDHIFKIQQTQTSQKEMPQLINGILQTGSLSGITNVGYAQDLANKMGSNSLTEILYKRGVDVFPSLNQAEKSSSRFHR